LKRGWILIFFAIVLGVSLLVFPAQSLVSARNALEIWFGAVIPTLLPFFVVVSLLEQAGVPDFLGLLLARPASVLFRLSGHSVYAFVISLLSGYPMGARMISRLVIDGRISRSEASRAACLCSTSGPLFLIGTVGAAMLGDPTMGYVITLSHFLGSFLTGFVFCRSGKRSMISDKRLDFSYARNTLEARSAIAPPLGKSLTAAISAGMSVMLQICGYIMVFSMLAGFLDAFGLFRALSALSMKFPLVNALRPPFIEAFLSGIIEMSTGCRMIAAASLPVSMALASVTFMVSFSSLSVLAQSLAYLSEAGISSSRFIIAKIFHGIVSSVFAMLCADIFWPGSQQTLSPVHPARLESMSAAGFIVCAMLILCLATCIFFANRKGAHRRAPFR
jgi:sporulation integral membrane protein YlbJ